MSNTYPEGGSPASSETPVFAAVVSESGTPAPRTESGPDTDARTGSGASSGSGAGTATGSTGSTGSGKADAVKEQASAVGSSAADSAKQVAGTAKEEASRIGSEAKSQAKDLYEQTRSELTEQAASQQKRVASGLRSLGDELSSMSDNSEGSGVAADLVSQAGSRISGVASWLDDRDPGSLLSEVKQFAARKPGTFIAIAAVAGLVGGRLTRSLVSDAKDEAQARDSSTPSGSGSSAGPGSTGTTAAPLASPGAADFSTTATPTYGRASDGSGAGLR